MPPSELHLSLLRLPRADARWRHLDAYGAHRLAWSGFDGVPPGERPFLFSHDTRGDVQSLLVQSTRPPDWHALSPDADVRVKAVDAAAVPDGARLAFTLRANPTVSRVFPDGKVRRIGVGTNARLAFERMGRPWPDDPDEVEVWRQASLTEWLGRAGARAFEVEAAEAGPAIARRVVRTDVSGRRPSGRPMTLHEVEMSGVLRVMDAAAFAAARAAGLGRGRAFGFGLLLLRVA